MANTYRCDACKGEFEKGWTDEAANAEALELFGVENAAAMDDYAVVCDDCFTAMGIGSVPSS